MGFIGKLNSLLKTGLEVNELVNTVNSSGILNGIDFTNLSPEGIKNIGSQISSNLKSQQSSILGGLNGISFDASSIEDIASSITPKDLGMDIPDFNKIMEDSMADMNKEMTSQNFDMPDMSEFDVDMSQFDAEMNSFKIDPNEFNVDMPDFDFEMPDFRF